MPTLTITAEVDETELDAFLRDDPDLTACLRARLSEVFGDGPAYMCSVSVTNVAVTETPVDAVTIAVPTKVLRTLAGIHEDFREMLDADDIDETDDRLPALAYIAEVTNVVA